MVTHLRSTHRIAAIASFVVLSGCGGDPDAGADAAVPSCTVTATSTVDTTARTITGKGAITCDAAATIRVETCVQWNPSGPYEDIMCQSATQTDVAQLEAQNVSSCGVATGRTFRTRVSTTVNRVTQPVSYSAEVSCE